MNNNKENDRTSILVANGLLTIQTLTLRVHDWVNKKSFMQFRADSRTAYSVVKIAIAERFRLGNYPWGLFIAAKFSRRYTPVNLQDDDPIGLAFCKAASSRGIVSLVAVKKFLQKNNNMYGRRQKSKRDLQNQELQEILRVVMKEEEQESGPTTSGGETRANENNSANIVAGLSEKEALGCAIEASLADCASSEAHGTTNNPSGEPRAEQDNISNNCRVNGADVALSPEAVSSMSEEEVMRCAIEASFASYADGANNSPPTTGRETRAEQDNNNNNNCSNNGAGIVLSPEAVSSMSEEEALGSAIEASFASYADRANNSPSTTSGAEQANNNNNSSNNGAGIVLSPEAVSSMSEEEALGSAIEASFASYADNNGQRADRATNIPVVPPTSLLSSLSCVANDGNNTLAFGRAGYQLNDGLDDDEALSIALETSFHDDGSNDLPTTTQSHRRLTGPARPTTTTLSHTRSQLGGAGYQLNGALNEDEALSIALETLFRGGDDADDINGRPTTSFRGVPQPTTTTPSQPTREPPRQLVCPITMELMEDPVIAADGHTYERSAIEQVFARAPLHVHPRSPIAGIPLVSRVLIPNVAVRSMCREFSEGNANN